MKWLSGNTLTLNDRGEMVELLQDMLDYLGYYAGEIDGHFGPDTVMAVKEAQYDYDFPVTGVVNAATMSLINDLCEEDGWDIGNEDYAYYDADDDEETYLAS